MHKLFDILPAMDNSNPGTPVPEVPSAPGPQPEQPTAPTPQPAQTPVPGNPMPGQVIGANGAISSTPTPPQPISQPPGTQPVAGNLMHEPDPPQSSKKKWVLLSILALAVVLVAAAALLLLRPKNKKGDDVSTQKSSQLTSAASSSIDAETSSWKTYSDKLITLKYPDGWSIKQNQYVGGGNFNITPPGDPSSTGTGGYLGEDDSTDNAKTNDSKTYWQRAYNSDGSNKIIAENSDSVNGYDTYNVESKDSIGSTTYSVVGKAGVKITIYYPTNDKSNDTYETIVKTLRFN